MQHLRARSPGQALFDETGRAIGYLEEIEIWRNRLWVAGWILAERVSLMTTAGKSEVQPSLPRPDVVRAGLTGEYGNVGFRLDMPLEGSTASLCAKIGGSRYIYPVPIPAPRATAQRIARLRLLASFLVALIAAAPAILRWRLTRDLTQRHRAKKRLGLTETVSLASELPDGLFRQSPIAAVAGPERGLDTPVTLIMPVYNAFEVLSEALDRVKRHTDSPWHLILIEDASTDDRVRPFLHRWTAACEAEEPGRITLIENPENCGFIQSVNSALAIAAERGDHVILLNSDALVPAGWAARLLRPILTQSRVASVTPMSNDAEIFSVPVICRAGALAPGQVDAIDAVARRLDPDVGLAEAPTGVGFCMAINIAYLRQQPQLDCTFGHGYGEEVDWCQKMRARGGRHLGMAGLFVEHRGGSSFGSAQKQSLIARNNAKISRRYPDYDAEVQTFIQTDPLAAQRLALAFALAAERQDGPLPVYLAHSLGGGAEFYLRDRLVRDTASGGSAALLRVGGNRRWQIELHDDEGASYGATESFDLVKALLDPVRALRVVYSCGVGDRDPATLPDCLMGLLRGAQDRLEILFHDFFPLSPSYTLLDGDGVFSGVPDADDPDPVHGVRRFDGSHISLSQWRALWGAAVDAADEVVVFSRDSADHVLKAYPRAASKLVLRPHQGVRNLPPMLPRRDAKPARPTIGVLGNIGYQKGARVLVDLAQALDRTSLGQLVLIGNIDPEYALPNSVPLHGDYRIEEIPLLVARYGITHWLIPSIWPETFSFTTREALATGLPVLCFDLGAQAEAVGAAPGGHVIPLAPSQDPATAILDVISQIPGWHQ